MRICIPTENKDGLQAKVNAHFGGSEYFIIYDTENNSCEVIDNKNLHHEHGMCRPLIALEDQNIDIVVCSGMGARAVMKLNEGGIKAYRATAGTVSEIVESFNNNVLEEITAENSCMNHSCK
ncbi:NifB/NifX family molybdenum-iron cluster-binding protein [bacterium]|nr:NifB/NifX family molybdenum-iron cluster-binding protein [bacterium]